jgi:hypothetical protein
MRRDPRFLPFMTRQLWLACRRRLPGLGGLKSRAGQPS